MFLTFLCCFNVTVCACVYVCVCVCVEKKKRANGQMTCFEKWTEITVYEVLIMDTQTSEKTYIVHNFNLCTVYVK